MFGINHAERMMTMCDKPDCLEWPASASPQKARMSHPVSPTVNRSLSELVLKSVTTIVGLQVVPSPAESIK